MDIKKRVLAARKLLETNGLGCFLLSSREDIFYYSGYKASEGNFLIIDKKQKPSLFVSPLENDAEKIKGVDLVYLTSGDRLIKELKGKLVGFDESNLKSWTFLNLHRRHIRLKKSTKLIKLPREVKTEEEIENIKAAIKISRKILDRLKFYNKTEIEVANTIEAGFKINNSEAAFDTIVSNGSSSIHHLPENRSIKKTEPTIIDFGAKYNWYCCDITRSFPGSQKKWKLVWENVKNIQEQIIDNVKPGIKMEDLQNLYKKLMGKNRYKIYHSFGHGLGLEVHEQITGELKEGMIITVEPGVYLKHFGGIRIEDDVLVRKGKAFVLTEKI